MCLLQFIQRLEIPIQVRPRVIPAVAFVMDLNVGPCIREADCSGIGLDIGKRVHDMCEMGGGNHGGKVFRAVYTPVWGELCCTGCRDSLPVGLYIDEPPYTG